MKRISMLAALFVLASGMQAFGSSSLSYKLAYNDVTGEGQDPDLNSVGNVAQYFLVNSPITVLDLGIYNASGTGTVVGTLEVGIYDYTTHTWITTATFTPGAYPLVPGGYDVYQAITPVTLADGKYEIDTFGWSASYAFGNQFIEGRYPGPVLNNFGGEITFYGVGSDDNTSFDAAPRTKTDSELLGAGTFAVSPEPNSLLLLGTGFVCLAGVLRRKLMA